MNKMVSLFKYSFKSSRGIDYKKSSSSLVKKILLAVILIICIIPFSIAIWKLTDTTYTYMDLIGKADLILVTTFFAISTMVLFFGLIYSIGTFYFSNDIETYLYLPIEPSHIVGVKFLISLLYEYVTIAVFYFPIIGAYGVRSGENIIFYIVGVIAFFILPIIPLIISSLIGMIIMRFSNVAKNKDFIKVMASILVFGVLLLFNYGMGKIEELGADKIILLLTKPGSSALEFAKYIVPTALFGIKALTSESILISIVNLILFIALSLVAYGIFYIISGKIYFKGVMGINEGGAKHKKLSEEYFTRKRRVKSKVLSYGMKELKGLIRVPAFFFNAIIAQAFILGLITVPLFISKSLQGDMSFLKILFDSIDKGFIVLLCMGIAVFMSGFNGIAVTSISREGKNLFIMKYIPMSYGRQLLGKLICPVIIGEVFCIILIFILAIKFNLTLSIILMLLLGTLEVVLVTSVVGMLIDLHSPKLIWESEQDLIRNNLSVIATPFLSIIIISIPLLINLFLRLKVGVISEIMLVYLACLGSLMIFIIMKKGEEILKNL